MNISPAALYPKPKTVWQRILDVATKTEVEWQEWERHSLTDEREGMPSLSEALKEEGIKPPKKGEPGFKECQRLLKAADHLETAASCHQASLLRTTGYGRAADLEWQAATARDLEKAKTRFSRFLD